MGKEKKIKRKHRFTGIIALLIIFVVGMLICVSYKYYCHMMEQKNEAAIKDYTVNDLTLRVDEQDKELKELQDWLDTPHLSDASKGLLYERMSVIYQNREDNANYYGCLGNALFYLKKAGENGTMANIYGDLANSYLVNDSLDNAQAMLDVIYDTCTMDEIGNLQVESMIYRVQAQIDLKRGNMERAMENLKKSRSCIDASNTNTFEEYYYVVDDMVEAQICFCQGQFDKAGKIIEKYKGSKYLEVEHHQAIAARSAVIPYYEIAMKLALRDGDIDAMRENLEKAVECCETYNFHKMELNLLDYVLVNYKTDKTLYREQIYETITITYEKLANLQTEQYSFLTNSLLNNAIHNMQEEENARIQGARKLRMMLVVVLIVLTMFAVLCYTWNQAHVDGLTGIANRRAFNEKYRKNRKHHKKFHLIIMDIDNFKHINDVYGHPVGDEVLRTIGKNLHLPEGHDIHMYRYGGEEFAIIMEERDEQHVLEFAEAMRLLVAKIEWEFGETVTISLGMSSNDTNADQLEEADQNLYFSKKNGKNVLSYRNKDGVQVLYRRD